MKTLGHYMKSRLPDRWIYRGRFPGALNGMLIFTTLIPLFTIFFITGIHREEFIDGLTPPLYILTIIVLSGLFALCCYFINFAFFLTPNLNYYVSKLFEKGDNTLEEMNELLKNKVIRSLKRLGIDYQMLEGGECEENLGKKYRDLNTVIRLQKEPILILFPEEALYVKSSEDFFDNVSFNIGPVTEETKDSILKLVNDIEEEVQTLPTMDRKIATEVE